MKIPYKKIPKPSKIAFDMWISEVFLSWLVLLRSEDKSKLVELETWAEICSYSRIEYDINSKSSYFVWLDNNSANVLDPNWQLIKKIILDKTTEPSEQYLLEKSHKFYVSWNMIYQFSYTTASGEIEPNNSDEETKYFSMLDKPFVIKTKITSHNILTWIEKTKTVKWHLVTSETNLFNNKLELLDELYHNIIYDSDFKKIWKSSDIYSIWDTKLTSYNESSKKMLFTDYYTSISSSEYDRVWTFSEGKCLVCNNWEIFVIDELENKLFTISSYSEVPSDIQPKMLSKSYGNNSKFINWEMFFDWKFYDSSWTTIRKLDFLTDISKDLSKITLKLKTKDIILCSVDFHTFHRDIDFVFNNDWKLIFEMDDLQGNCYLSLTEKWIFVNDGFNNWTWEYYKNEQLFADIEPIGKNMTEITEKNKKSQYLLNSSTILSNYHTIEEIKDNSKQCIDKGDSISISWRKFKKKLLKIK